MLAIRVGTLHTTLRREERGFGAQGSEDWGFGAQGSEDQGSRLGVAKREGPGLGTKRVQGFKVVPLGRSHELVGILTLRGTLASSPHSLPFSRRRKAPPLPPAALSFSPSSLPGLTHHRAHLARVMATLSRLTSSRKPREEREVEGEGEERTAEKMTTSASRP